MSNFEKNQQSIIRQSQIKSTLEYCRMIGVALTLREIIGITNVLVDYCENGYNKDLGERLNKIDTFISEKLEEPSL